MSRHPTKSSLEFSFVYTLSTHERPKQNIHKTKQLSTFYVSAVRKKYISLLTWDLFESFSGEAYLDWGRRYETTSKQT